jgi:hypothetical protein
VVELKKILLVCSFIKSKKDIKSYTDQWSYHIKSQLEKREDIELTVIDFLKHDDTNWINEFKDKDYALFTGVRYLTKIDKSIIDKIRECNPNIILGHICDGSLLDTSLADINFTVRDDRWRYENNENNRLNRHNQHNYYIGWAADKEIYYPDQSDDIKRIFVDHTLFDCSSFDKTLTILMNLKKYKESIEVYTQTDNGIEKVDLNNISVKPYNRSFISNELFAKELRKSHIFIVTHKESLGLCVLEAALCGCLILTPEDCIAKDRLETINYHIISSNFNINDYDINIEDNVKKASINTWKIVSDNIITGFDLFYNKRFISDENK